VFSKRASPFKDSNDDSYSSEEFEVVKMTVRASKVLGWRKTESKGVHKFGISKNAMALDGTTAVPTVTYDESRETEDALNRASLGRAIGAILLKGAQMSR
jgi:hypothetical protein